MEKKAIEWRLHLAPPDALTAFVNSLPKPGPVDVGREDKALRASGEESSLSDNVVTRKHT